VDPYALILGNKNGLTLTLTLIQTLNPTNINPNINNNNPNMANLVILHQEY